MTDADAPSEPPAADSALDVDATPEYGGVLLYDGDCPFCSAAASALRRVEDVGVVPWDDEAARAFLRAQFGEVPFALVLADRERERLWAGREAARELCDRAGLPVLVRDVVGEDYERLADGIRRVSGLDREPDPYHDVYPMAEAARDRYAALAANATKTHGLR